VGLSDKDIHITKDKPGLQTPTSVSTSYKPVSQRIKLPASADKLF